MATRGRDQMQLICITHISEVIMFSPCVLVCVYVCHNVCPDNLTMKDWCHTNNILQVHSWWSLVVQVMFHALMTSSMTSPGHKVGQIFWNDYISINISARASIKSSKYRKCSWLSCWYIQLRVLLLVKSLLWPQNGVHFEILNTALIWHQL